MQRHLCVYRESVSVATGDGFGRSIGASFSSVQIDVAKRETPKRNASRHRALPGTVVDQMGHMVDAANPVRGWLEQGLELACLRSVGLFNNSL